MDNIWGADLAIMQLISEFDKRIRFLLCDVDIFIKYAWVIPFKYEKVTAITNPFQKLFDKSNCKLNKYR